MKQLSRLGIQRMIDTSGSAGSGGSGGNDISLAGYATEAWVEENYLSKEFFLRLFGIHGTDENDDPVDVEPNDPDTTITDIEAKFGFWTEQYISALGQGSGGGGGGGGSDTLDDLIDVELTNPDAGQVLKYNGTKWVNSAASAGTVTSVGMSVPTGFAVTGSPITVSGVLSLSFAAGYSLPTTAKQTNWDAAYTWTSVPRTTLADYGITDAKFGTPGTDRIPITLGSTTQSVLTQHQSLANYYTKSETDGKFLTISFFRSLFRAYTSNNTEVQPNDGSTSTIASIKAMFGFWTEQYISALGQSSGGGGGVTLNQPLLGINSAGLSSPSSAGLGLVFNGSAWVYTNAASMSVYGLTVSSTLQAYNAIFGSTVSGAAFSATGGGFSVSGKDNTYVLLAGGGTKLLSEIGGGGAVNSITLGQGGTNYTPDASGIITLPPYPSGTVTSVSYNGGNPITPTSGVVSLGGLCVTVKVGSTDYGVSSSGVISLPAYPSTSGLVSSVVIGANGTPISPVNGVVTLPAYPSKTSDLTNDSGFITGYTDTKNTAGATNNVTKLYLIGAESQAANPVTYSNSNIFIGASGGLKVSGRVFNAGDDEGIVIGMTGNYAGLVLGTHNGARTVLYHTYDNNVYKSYWKFHNGTTNYNIYHPEKSGTIALTSDITDTKNTVGNADAYASSGAPQLYLVGTASYGGSGSYAQSSVNRACYVGTDNCLYSNSAKVLTSMDTRQITAGSTYYDFYSPYNTTVNLDSVYLQLSGGTMTGKLTVKSPIVGYNYNVAANAAAFILDKPGSHMTGIGAHTTSDMIYFGACNSSGQWVDTFKQIWNFNGTIQQEGNNVIHAGNIASQSVANATTVGDGSVKLYAEYNNEINFGGTNNSTTIYFSYRARDSREIVSTFIFGGSNGTANITANSFKKRGGTSTQFLKADGSVDSNTYLTSAPDTKNTAGASSGASMKLFIVGAQSQTDGIKTYSNAYCFIGDNGAYYNTKGTGRAYSWGYSSSGGTEFYIGSDSQSNSDPKMFFISTTSTHSITFHTNNTERMRITADGKVGIAQETSFGSFKFVVNGACAGTSWSNTSDLRKKNVIADKNLELWQVAQAPMFTFRWKDKEQPQDIHVGTSAQYWYSHLPEVVTKDGEGYLSLQYDVLALLAAVTTAKKVQDHETRIQVLERENAALRNELNQLKTA